MLPWDMDWLIRIRQAGNTGSKSIEFVRFGGTATTAARATVPSLFSVGLEDVITPPSTVFAAYNEYAGPKEIRVWPFSGHEAPEADHVLERLEFAAAHLRS